VKEPLTGWALTDAYKQVDCPRCGSTAGEFCRTPKGRKAWPTHTERLTVLHEKFGYEPWTRKGAISGAEVLKLIRGEK
jgi:hypothetical protein